MSARNTKAIAPKPFCKVCHDAGKTEKEYTSHFVKSEPGTNGKVVCPTLLAQECRFCFEHGHTAGYCPAIASNKKAEEKALRIAAQREANEKKATTKSVVVMGKKPTNIFAALDESSDSEDEKKVSKKVTKKTTIKPTIAATIATKSAPKVEEFPALPSNPKSKTSKVTPLITGYASVAAKTPQEYETEKYEQQIIINSMKRQLPPITNGVLQRHYADEDWKQNESAPTDYDSDNSWSDDKIAVAVAPRPLMKASLMDWSVEVDSDEEDW